MMFGFTLTANDLYEMNESVLVGEASKSESAPRAFGVEIKSKKREVSGGQISTIVERNNKK